MGFLPPSPQRHITPSKTHLSGGGRPGRRGRWRHSFTATDPRGRPAARAFNRRSTDGSSSLWNFWGNLLVSSFHSVGATAKHALVCTTKFVHQLEKNIKVLFQYCQLITCFFNLSVTTIAHENKTRWKFRRIKEARSLKTVTKLCHWSKFPRLSFFVTSSPFDAHSVLLYQELRNSFISYRLILKYTYTAVYCRVLPTFEKVYYFLLQKPQCKESAHLLMLMFLLSVDSNRTLQTMGSSVPLVSSSICVAISLLRIISTGIWIERICIADCF